MGSLFVSYRRGDSPDTVKLIHERLQQRLPRWEIFYDHQSIPLGEKFPELLRAKVTAATAVLVIIGPRWLEILHERRSAPIDHVREEVRLALESGTSVVPILVGRAVMPTDADLADFADLQPLLKRNGRPVRPDPDFDSDLAPVIAHLKQHDAGETIGTILDDKYTLTAEIGHGGMGVVYTAEQKQPVKRRVAVKLIKPGMDSRDVLARFDAERQALAVMDHPNIAKVLDAGMAATGRPFFVMEYVKGVPITQYCDDKKLTLQERLNLFIPVCNAIQHAHQKGILHRDIKPSNVLVEVVDGKPVPKVIDFGLAKALGHKLTDKTLHTALDTRVGTLEYSAPEQAAGRTFDVDTRSDIYSLGVLLYELLTGSLPFTHEELLKIGEEAMRRVIREVEPVKPSKRLSSSGELPAIAANRHLEPNRLTRLVQGDLDWIVMKCLEKENARRYETANQLGQELQRFLADEPVQAGPPSARYRMKKFLRRNKGPAMAGALVFLALIAGIVGTSIGLFQAEQARDAEKLATNNALDTAEANESLAKANEKLFENEKKARDAEKLATQKALDAAEANERLAKANEGIAIANEKLFKDEKKARDRAEELLATSTVQLAKSCFEENNVGLAEDLLEQVDNRFRGAPWKLLKNYVAGSLFTMRGHTGEVTSVAFAAGGQVLASASIDQPVKLWDARTGTELRTLRGHTSVVTSVAFAADGQVLASASLDGTVKLWDARTGAELRTLRGHALPVWSVAFSADGQVLASASDKTVKLWDARTGAERRTLRGHTGGVTSVAFAADSQVLASASVDGTVKLWDARTGAELRTLRGHTGEVMSVAFAADGQVLASASWDHTIKLWDARTGQERRTLRGHTELVRSVAFSADGQVLASASDKTVKLWDARTGAELRTLRGHTGEVTSVAFAADGLVLASASLDNTVKLWHARTGQELRTLRGHTAQVKSVAFAGDGQVLASASLDKTVKLWDARTGAELRTLRGHTTEVISVAFAAGGQVLASASYDNTVKLWDARTGAELRTLRGHTRDVTSVAFAADGKTLWSRDDWGHILAWDVATGNRRDDSSPAGGWSGGNGAWSADGSIFAQGQDNGLIVLAPRQISERERRFRMWVTAPDLHLHRELAETADRDKPFALAFRLGRYFAAQHYYATEPNAKDAVHRPAFPDGIACTGVLYKDAGIAPARLLIGTSRALEGDPQSWLNHAFHGGALYRNGEHAKALAELQQAVKLHGKPSPLTHNLLGLTHLAMGQQDKAKDALTQAQPAKDAPWEDLFLQGLLQPEIDAALAKAEEKRGVKEK